MNGVQKVGVTKFGCKAILYKQKERESQRTILLQIPSLSSSFVEPDHIGVEDPDKDTAAEDLEDIAVEDTLVLDMPDRIPAVVEDNQPEDIPVVDILPLEDTL